LAAPETLALAAFERAVELEPGHLNAREHVPWLRGMRGEWQSVVT
jgi:hypothetical protein